MKRTRKNLARAAAVAVAASCTAGAVAVVAAPGTAETPAPPNAAAIAADSVAVQQANTNAGLGLQTAKARGVDMSAAPAGLAGQTVFVIPSAKGPCLLRKVNSSVVKGLVQNDALACGAGIAPTVSIGPEGTIGVVGDVSDSVTVVQRDGASREAKIGSDGVWFASPDATAAAVKSGDTTTKIELR